MGSNSAILIYYMQTNEKKLKEEIVLCQHTILYELENIVANPS